MRILVLSFYFRPDLSAGSFRTTVLVDSLRELVGPGSSIDVVTTLPNRYSSFASDALEWERLGPVTIRRIALPTHASGIYDQSKAFLTFARAALAELGGRRYDVVFATSSRLMTAMLGAVIAQRTRARLYLDIRDIFVDTIKDIAPRAVAWLARPIFSVVERWTIARADCVNLVSRGFEDYFRRRYPAQRFSFFTNGIDDEFLVPAPARPPPASAERVEVMYAGNIGDGQGLHVVLPGLARRLESRVRFLVVGDGGRRRALEQALAAAEVTNVVLRAPVARAELVALYRAADVLFLHLNDHEAFKKVLPSKVFEYGALGKPVWAGLAGHAADFVRSEMENSAVFPPCDVDAAVRAFESLTIADAPRADFINRYSRAQISRAMAKEVLDVAAEAR